ncbi:hypothetical protein [Streptomyces roseus]|uniref:Uncharacterized protein n=1 Tax=Streptomyces roseus TaxID=66430 RepID=A0A0J6XRT0_9ACTN|nr:hypothetical protein [Streptomyces roseus]KMO96987.1 hypothetical protein ACS04_15000 [Streptomyces roseus]
MSRRTRSQAAQAAVPTTVHIPRQRGRRRQVPPVIVVVSEQPTLTARATMATGRFMWRHRRAWAPTGIAVTLLVLATILHLFVPWTGAITAAACLVPPGHLVWLAKTRPAGRTAWAWRFTLAILALAGLGWLSLALWFGPANAALMGLWSLTTLTMQTLWLTAGRTTSKGQR